MVKSELIVKITEATEMTRKKTDEVLTATLDAIECAYKSGDKVQLMKFGTFEAKDCPAYLASSASPPCLAMTWWARLWAGASWICRRPAQCFVQAYHGSLSLARLGMAHLPRP